MWYDVNRDNSPTDVMDMAGRLITVSLARCRQVSCDERWQITRSYTPSDSLLWVPKLAPSPRLFNQFINRWKDQDPQMWWPLYKEQFVRELEQEEKKSALRRLWKKLKAGKSIALVCFCPDASICHRSLVAEFMRHYGIEAFEYEPPSQHEVADDPYVTTLF